MSNYFVVQIGAFLLVAGIAGFLAGLWLWSIRSSGRMNAMRRTHDAGLRSAMGELATEKAAAAEAHAATEAAMARNRALEARIKQMEDTSAAAAAANEAEICGLRERIAGLESRAAQAAVHEEIAQNWSRRFDAAIEHKDAIFAAKVSGLEAELEDHKQTLTAWENHVRAASREHSAELQVRDEQLAEANERIRAAQAKAAEVETGIRQLIARRDGEILGLREHLSATAAMQQALQERNSQYEQFQQRVESAAAQARAEHGSLHAEIDALRFQLFERGNRIQTLETDAALLSHVRQGMRERQTAIDGLKLQLGATRRLLDQNGHGDWENALVEKERQIQLLEANLIEASAAQAPNGDGIASIHAEVADRDERLRAWESRYEAALGEMHAEAGRLRGRITELESAFPSEAPPQAMAMAAGAGSGVFVSTTVWRSDSLSPVINEAPSVPELQARLRLLSMRGIQFLPDSAEILPECLPLLDEAYGILSEMPGTTVEIAGHTDSWGDPAHNLALSKGRAQAVRDYLLGQGISGDQLDCAGYGDSRPLADNNDPDGRFANRRIEFLVRA